MPREPFIRDPRARCTSSPWRNTCCIGAAMHPGFHHGLLAALPAATSGTGAATAGAGAAPAVVSRVR